MYRLEKTIEFDRWLKRLKDRRAVARILVRLQRAENGNLGDVKRIGHGLSEMRIDYGGGYRLYFKIKKDRIVLLISGGDKNSQFRDIEKARKLWQHYERDVNGDHKI